MSGFYQASNGKEILQNFIRAGDRVWDVAYEEMEPEELRKVAVVPFKGGRHREFCSLGEIRRISESYYPGMRYFSSLSALGWVGAFHSSLCFQLPRNYLMQSGKNREFGFDEVSTYLRTVARPLELTPELKARLARAVTDILAFGTQRFTPIESFFLNSVRLHLENPTGDVERHLRHAHDFVSWQAEKTGLSFEEVFVELSDVMEGLIAEISDEYYDRLHAERKGEIGKLNFLEES
jgi:hypothetical protein